MAARFELVDVTDGQNIPVSCSSLTQKRKEREETKVGAQDRGSRKPLPVGSSADSIMKT